VSDVFGLCAWAPKVGWRRAKKQARTTFSTRLAGHSPRPRQSTRDRTAGRMILHPDLASPQLRPHPDPAPTVAGGRVPPQDIKGDRDDDIGPTVQQGRRALARLAQVLRQHSGRKRDGDYPQEEKKVQDEQHVVRPSDVVNSRW